MAGKTYDLRYYMASSGAKHGRLEYVPRADGDPCDTDYLGSPDSVH